MFDFHFCPFRSVDAFWNIVEFMRMDSVCLGLYKTHECTEHTDGQKERQRFQVVFISFG